MGEFVATRLRDAFGVIRGFVYQIDVTLERWLALRGNELLELERGEDVDMVIRAIRGDDEAARALEQIKYRSSSITLRAAEAIEAIANAIEHLKANPGIALSFQFTTNAMAGVERPSVLKSGGSAIAAWENVRLGNRIGAEADEILNGIRILLNSRPKPERVRAETWQYFQAIVKSDDNTLLDRIVRSFTWCTRSPNASSIKDSVRAKLISLGHAENESLAEQQYERLFLHVLNLLTTAGQKRLDIPELARLLALPPLNPERVEELARVAARLKSLDERVEAIELQQTNDKRFLEDKIDDLSRSHGMTASLIYGLSAPNLTPSQPPNKFIHRQPTVLQIAPSLAKRTWLELTGGPGTGKSELARLLALAGGGIRAWLDFRELDVEAAAHTLDHAVRYFAAANSSGSNGQMPISEFVAKVGTGILVLDDLPRNLAGDPFARRLLDLISVCGLLGVTVITTSIFQAPTWVVERLNPSCHIVQATPPFTDDDTRELLRSYSAPAPWTTDKAVSTLTNSVSGHPTLLIGAVRYLQSRKWKIAEKDFVDFISGTVSQDVRRETVQRLLRLVEDGETRELLYRANLAITTLSENLILNLAGVNKAVSRPHERLNELLDVCIQQAPNKRLRVSPLFKSLGSADVSQQTAAQCHAVLGTAIMAKRSISVTEATAAISHFIAAADHDRAGIVLLQSLVKLNSYNSERDGGLLPFFWNTTPIPDSINLGLRIGIRANQAVRQQTEGKPFAYAMSELEKLLAQAGVDESWAVVTSCVTAQRVLLKHDVSHANKLLLKAVRALPSVKVSMGKAWKEDGHHIEDLFWANGTKVCGVKQLDNWIETMDSLTPVERGRVFSSELVDGGCWHTADALWLSEADKAEETQDWDAVEASLRRLLKAADDWDQPMLQAASIRALIVVVTEYKNDFASALQLASTSLESKRFSGKASFTILECVGRQFLYKGQQDEANNWLERALLELGKLWPQKRAQTLMNQAKIATWPEAEELLKAAHAAVVNDSDTSGQTFIQVNGELGLAYFLNGKMVEALRSIDTALEYLLQERDDTDRLWRATAAMLGHTIGFMSTVTLTGKKPEKAVDGSPYAEPRIGMLATVNLKLSDWIVPDRMALLISMVASMAERVGEDEINERRSMQSFDLARQDNQLLVIASVGTTHAIGLVASDHPSEAMDLSLQSASAGEALAIVRNSGGDVYATNRTVQEILGPKPSALWSRAEYQTVAFTMLPILLRLATLKMSAHPKVPAMAKELLSAIEVVQRTASDQKLWVTVGKIISQTFVQPVPGTLLNQLGNDLRNEQKPALQAMAYLGATLQDDVSVENALVSHLYVFAETRIFLSEDSSPYRRLVVPFVEVYWQKVVFEQSFRFTPPAFYRDLFADAVALSEERRVQAILKLVFEGLKVAVPAKYRGWLNHSTNGSPSV